MIATERLYLNKDKTRVCKSGDPKAAFLLAGIGSEVPKQYEKLMTQTKETIASVNKELIINTNKNVGGLTTSPNAKLNINNPQKAKKVSFGGGK